LVELLRQIPADSRDKDIKALLGETKVSFRASDASAKTVVGVSMQLPPSDDSSGGQRNLCDLISNFAVPGPTPNGFRKPFSRLPATRAYICIVVLAHIALFAVLVSYVIAGNDIYLMSLAGSDGRSYLTAIKWKFMDGTAFGPRFFMTLLLSLLFVPFWEKVEMYVRILVPYRRLRDPRDNNSKHLFRMYLHGVPFTTFFKALAQGNYYHAFIALVTVSSYILLILVAGVPFNYGQIKNVTFWSSLASACIIFVMMIAMFTLVFWYRTNPQMVRKPETLVNVWLLMCGSKLLEDFKGRELREAAEEARTGKAKGFGDDERYWFGKSEGVDGVERWMVDGKGLQKRAGEVAIQQPERYGYI
jgi:hypothetical protein